MSLDMVVLRLNEERLELLLETRDRPPFSHCWQLPALRIDDPVEGDLAGVAELRDQCRGGFAHAGGLRGGEVVAGAAAQAMAWLVDRMGEQAALCGHCVTAVFLSFAEALHNPYLGGI